MENLIIFIVQNLVDDAEGVTVESVSDPSTRNVTYRIRVAPDDVGKVVGKEGRIARALRDLIRSIAIKHKHKVYLDIVQS